MHRSARSRAILWTIINLWIVGPAVVIAILLSCCTPTYAGPSAASTKFRMLLASEERRAKSISDGWQVDLLKNIERQDRSVLNDINRINRNELSSEEKTLYDVLRRQLGSQVEQFRLGLYMTPYWDDSRFGRSLLATLSNFSNGLNVTSTDATTVIQQVESLAIFADRHIELLTLGLGAKMMPSKPVIQPTIAAIEYLLRTPPERWTVYTSVDPKGTAEDRARIRAALLASIHQALVPALTRLHDFLTNQYLPACPDFLSLKRWPNGGDVYREFVRRETTISIEPEKVHELGVHEVERIHDKMAIIAAKEGFPEPAGRFIARTFSDPQFYFKTPSELAGAYRDALMRIEPRLGQLFYRLPSRKIDIEEARYRGPAAIYNSKNGAVVVEVSRPDLRPRFEIIPLMLHEGSPGHHLQLSLERELSSTRDRWPPFLRRQSAAFSEGWALYAETLGEDLGLYDEPYARFGELSMDLLRAVRVVVDTGVHYYGWTEEKARQYFAEATGRPQEVVDTEMTRFSYPGSSLAYKVGQLQFLAIRNDLKKALGNAFDIRNMHEAILTWGPLPLDVLDRKVRDCLKRRECVLRAPLGRETRPRDLR